MRPPPPPESGSRAGRILVFVAGLAVLCASGGYYGWRQYVEQRRVECAARFTSATRESLDGDRTALDDAERHLAEARKLDPHDPHFPTLLLFVQLQRALEGGVVEAPTLRAAITRARHDGAERPWLDAATAVADAAEGKRDEARRGLAAALAASPNDASLLYVVGRLEQRLGDESASAHLGAAVASAPTLAAAVLAVVEAKAAAEDPEGALLLLDTVLSRQPGHLRGTLWRALLTTETADTTQALAALDALAPRLAQGAPSDRALADVARVRLLRRAEQPVPASAALERAASSGVTEPRLLALIAQEAQRSGDLERAQVLAQRAVEGAPTERRYRVLLAEIQLARRDGAQAFSTLAPLSTSDPEVLRLSARAALLVGSDQAIAAMRLALDAYVREHAADVEARALLLRLAVRLGDTTRLDAAKALALEAPTDPLVTLALGEAALAAREPAVATAALEQCVRAAPMDADAHFLLGRARRMSGNAVGAEESLRKAVELSPTNVEAAIALGGLLLDLGKYADAEAVYQGLARAASATDATSALFARLGHLEALIGMGRFADARTELDALSPEDRARPPVRLAAVRLLLAEAKPADAITELAPLLEGDAPKSVEVLALYGDALFDAGQVDLASSQYSAALAQDADAPEALLGRARVALRAEHTVDATDLLDHMALALETHLRPPALRARMLLAQARVKLLLNVPGEARTLLTRATALEGCPAEVYFWLGEATWTAETAAARTAYGRYLELVPEGEYAVRARRALERGVR